MIYSQFPLSHACLLVGFLLLAMGGVALVRPEDVKSWLTAFPRSRPWGFILLGVATAWAWYLIDTIDLGEFANWKTRLLILIPIAALLTGRFVDEFLSARALGMVALLAAEPLLESAFQQREASRLFLVVLAYVWIVAAMFWIGTPYVLRDQIRWITSLPLRFRGTAAACAGYGLILLILGLTLHRSA
jgi:hypothetical protein